MALTIIADIHAREDLEDFVGGELRKLIEPTRSEAGCIRYELHHDLNDGRHFMFVESWASRELWQAHMRACHIAAYAAAVDGSIEQFVLYEMENVA